jgi:trk system potassium uptake protein TrkH
MATGGFSTKNASIAHYNSIYIESVIMLFMFLAGVNFSLHYQFLRGNLKSYFKDKEFIFYTCILFSSIVLVTLINLNYYGSWKGSLRFSSFQVISITTTTGYCTYDFDKWPIFSKLLLLTLMFVGGCAGSTGGGMKNIRIMILIRKSFQEIKKIVYPQAVIPLKFGQQVIPQDTAITVLAFFILYILIFVVCSLIMSMLGLDLISALASVAATIGNIGPGLAKVGASQNYAHIPYLGKIILSFCMLIGRLEIYTVLVLFLPSTWRK